MRILWIVILAIFSVVIFKRCTRLELPVVAAAGLPYEPIQVEISPEKTKFSNQYDLERVATYAIYGSVLGVERYYIGKEAELSPIDLAIGWGTMLDALTYEGLSFSQSGRFYFYRFDGSFNQKYPCVKIAEHSANVHIIPKDEFVRKQVLNLRAGARIYLRGYLVNAQDVKNNWQWKTSMRRTDTGGGACELMLVESVELIDRRN